jgi:type I restriction enzyme, S subunit
MPQDLYKLPNGWEWKELSSVCQKITDGSHNPPKGKESGLPMLSSRNVFNGELVWDNYRLISEEEFERENKRTMITDGDVLLTIVGTIGRSAVVRNIPQDFTLQRSVAVLSSDQVAPEYLSLFFRSPSVQDYLASEAKGAAQKGVYLKQLKIIQIPLPPLAEQERIVEKLDALFRRIDDAANRLNQILKHSQALFASALDHAISPKKLPDGWEQKKFIECCVLKRGYDLPTRLRNAGPYPLFSANGVTDAVDQFKVKGPGVVTGRSGTIGQVHFVADDFWPLNTALYVQDFCGNDEMFVCYFLKNFDLSRFASGAAVPTLNRNTLSAETVMFPNSKEEQHRIVEHLDGLSERIQTLEKTTRNRLAHLAALKASLLDAAFRGKL